MKVSVIIPAYKEIYLLNTLQSVFAQSFTDFEVIVINDGSPYPIDKILRPLAEAGRIRYFEQDNRGVAAARNRGLREARCELIAFLDDDDYWPEDKLDWQVRYLEHHPEVGMVLGSWAMIGKEGLETHRIPLKEMRMTRSDFLVRTQDALGSLGQTLIRRELFSQVNGFDENLSGADDFDLCLKIAGIAIVMSYGNMALYYRVHQLNASHNPLLMCLTNQIVIDRHLPSFPPKIRSLQRLKAAQWLYFFRGQAVIRHWKRRLWSGKRQDSWKYMQAIAWFLRGSVLDPGFLVTICKEIMPARIFAAAE
jgi:glycosyltransferase involved in cell wall biosynthesis